MRNRIIYPVLFFVGFAAFFICYGFSNPPEKTTESSNASMVEKGKQLVLIGGCNDCHTPKKFTDKGPVPDESRLLSGAPAGAPLPKTDLSLIGPGKWGGYYSNDLTTWVGPWGVSFAANLTPDDNTGTGLWKVDNFIQALRTGKHMGSGRNILPPMPWEAIGQMSDQDLKDIFAYLHSLPPVKNLVHTPIPPSDLKADLK